ncbi:MAG: hypothetical protein E6K89_04660 [Thaumarchaeota archaeon]|nr:MAG: hypothetical protein E6K89_04660 [Nitrososphaerota archaeon]
MNLAELEVIASELIEQEKMLDQIDFELEFVEGEFKQQPKRAGREKKFYSLIGIEWKDSEELSQRRAALREDKEKVQRIVNEARDKLVKGFSSGELVVPLDPDPVRNGEGNLFRYRANASYPKAVQELASLLGMSVPLQIDEVEISPDQIRSPESDPYLAKEEVVNAFDKIRKTVALKLRGARRTQF